MKLSIQQQDHDTLSTTRTSVNDNQLHLRACAHYFQYKISAILIREVYHFYLLQSPLAHLQANIGLEIVSKRHH